jgi:hypothetical protein
VTEGRGGRRSKLLDDLKETIIYWELEEALERTLWKSHLEEGMDLS